MKPLVIYIAGPYSAATPEAIEANVAIARQAGIAVMQRGHVVLCPHTMTYGWDQETGLTYEHFIRADLVLLERCDAILMVGDWRSSPGAIGELQFAREHDLAVYFAVEDLPVVT